MLDDYGLVGCHSSRSNDLSVHARIELESVASAVEGNDPSEPTARCINDTKKRQQVTRSGLPRLRCCVCHIHHKCAMKSPAATREFFKMVFQQVCHFKVDVIAGDANAAAYWYYKNQEYQDLYNAQRNAA